LFAFGRSWSRLVKRFGEIANLASWVTGTEGSNPSLSAKTKDLLVSFRYSPTPAKSRSRSNLDQRARDRVCAARRPLNASDIGGLEVVRAHVAPVMTDEHLQRGMAHLPLEPRDRRPAL